MAANSEGLIGRILHRRTLARWQAAARAAAQTELTTLRAQRQQARQLQTQLQALSHTADDRLALPRIGSSNFARPGGTDWSWRPGAWRTRLDPGGVAPAPSKTRLGQELTVFHDCNSAELLLRQIRNRSADDLAAFGLMVEVFRFDGSFLSLVIDLPVDACAGLKKQHLIRLGAHLESERPLSVLARLNIKHGPNTEQLLIPLPHDQNDVAVEFDLAYSPLNESRVERMWLDLILEKPQMNAIAIRDLNFARYPRAAL